MIKKFLKQTSFASQEDFIQNFKVNVPKDFNFAYDIVDEWASVAPDKKALCWTNDKDEHRNFTFKEIKEMSDKTASFFQTIGIRRKDKVMLLLKRNYEFWSALLALHKLGAVAVPATHLLTEKDIVYRNNVAKIDAVFCSDDEYLQDNIIKARHLSPTVKIYITKGKNIPDGWEDYEKGIKNAPPFSKPKSVNSNDDMMLLYFTSGTTGNPKMAAHDFTYPLAHIVTAKYWHNLHENSLHFTLADTGWAKAVWGKIYGQWIAGASVFTYDHEKFSPSDVLRLIEKYKITSFCAPPTVYRFMIQEDLKKYDLSSLEYCTTAGESLNYSVFKTFYQATGVKIREAFGQTETVPIIITFPWITAVPGAMGIANPQFDVKLIDSEGKEVEPEEHGEIVIDHTVEHPLGLFMGYFNNSDKNRQVFSSYGYHTGDIAWKDKNGYFWYVGRSDDVIKSSGYRIGPFEVESALLTHDAVIECAITGVPDKLRGQVVKATIVLSDKCKNKADEDLKTELQNHVKHTTAPYKYPRIIEFVDALPKTISGKIKRAEIRQWKTPEN
ncbi:MAG: AMP-binding protein [Flavobacteriaceae bacterium]|jgi:acetyl-CoA synthetase|nr:AMP-binding protein [Flavobacteriaceae bacterium]